MTNLKTLKDFEMLEDWETLTKLRRNQAVILQTETLRQEAIKWVEELNKGGITLKTGTPITQEGGESYYLSRREEKIIILFIRLFFNLTEEDLK